MTKFLLMTTKIPDGYSADRLSVSRSRPFAPVFRSRPSPSPKFYFLKKMEQYIINNNFNFRFINNFIKIMIISQNNDLINNLKNCDDEFLLHHRQFLGDKNDNAKITKNTTFKNHQLYSKSGGKSRWLAHHCYISKIIDNFSTANLKIFVRLSTIQQLES